MIKFPKNVVKVFKSDIQGIKKCVFGKTSFENDIFMKVWTKLCISQEETTHSTKKTKNSKI